MSQIDLTDIYGTFQPNIKEYAFFSEPHGTFSKVDHVLVTKQISMDSPKRSITHCILLDHLGFKLVFNNNTSYRKPANS